MVHCLEILISSPGQTLCNLTREVLESLMLLCRDVCVCACVRACVCVCVLTTTGYTKIEGGQIELFNILKYHENVDHNIFLKIKTGK